MSRRGSNGVGTSRANLTPMVRSLVLNATNEPLSVVPGRRGALLVFEHKADIVHESEHALHSERTALPIPSVLRLRYYVHVPYTNSRAISRRVVFARDGHRCQYCGGHADSIDHVTPRSRGGANTWDNVVAACRPCNTRKRDRLLSELPMGLRRAPEAPSRATLLTASAPLVPDPWVPYLDVRRSA
jgi:5-methylcytosine-specific restriction endonuclease McrA